MGGASGVLKEARRAMSEGDYRWAAEILSHLVFAEPGNVQAKALLADGYEQLGYQAESAIWRNIYLSGASELRNGVKPRRFLAGPGADLLAAMSTASLFDTMATRLNPEVIGDRAMTLSIELTDTRERALVHVRNAVLVAEMGKTLPQPTVAVKGTRQQLSGVLLGQLPLEAAEGGGLLVSGDRKALLALQKAIERPPADYAIVTP
jgi:alkyl sulfatase BDS1-like metallo-beta-lactamase superfamily hydrolase